MPDLTAERLAELRREVREWMCDGCNTVYPGPPQPGIWCVQCPQCGGDTAPRGVIERRRLEREVERLRREREVLMEALTPASEAMADLDKGYYRVAKQDPGGYVMGSVSVASLVTVIESTRKALALLDSEEGGASDA